MDGSGTRLPVENSSDERWLAGRLEHQIAFALVTATLGMPPLSLAFASHDDHDVAAVRPARELHS
jgi:hypothetical protein